MLLMGNSCSYWLFIYRLKTSSIGLIFYYR
nr:MAG TPA: hypothetical protein [Caudoviricetes sp.]